MRPLAPVAVAYWIELDAGVPIFSGGMNLPHIDGIYFPRPVPERFAERARPLLAHWTRLAEGRRAELSYRMKVRAARWLGPDPDARRRISKLIGDVYSARSKAVHTGRLPAKTGGRPTSELLLDGYEFASEAIIRLIEEPAPEWNDLVLQ